MDFRSSYLSEDGELLNLTWNDTSPNGANWVKKPAPSVYEWDDAAWVMAGCFIIFGKLIKGRLILFNHFIDMRTTINLSISCRKNV